MIASLVWLLLVYISVSPLAEAQFPAVCNTEASLASKICCPNSCGAHGTCVNITEKVQNSWSQPDIDADIVQFLKNGPPGRDWPMDVRYQWPLRVFQSVCECDLGWGGYDCSRCDLGYIEDGEECVKRASSQLYERKEFSKLSQQKRDDYLRILKAAKNEAEDEMEWAVVMEEPMHTDDDPTVKLQNVSTYDMLVVLHFLSAREKDNDNCKAIVTSATGGKEIDFAHEFASFTTWHRYYLLIIETELRRIAKKLDIDDNFVLSYWDWNEKNDIFNDKHFGGPFPGSIARGEQVEVTGEIFENGNWPVVCQEHYKAFFNDTERNMANCKKVRQMCNVQNNRAQNIRLARGAYKNDKWQRLLPGNESIQMALSVYNNNEYDGFRKRLEGFVDLCSGNDIQCTISNLVDDSIHNNLHNAVHLYIGGHMRPLGTASNDPIFFLHHGNIDRILESWLSQPQFAGNQLPPFFQPIKDTVKHPGFSEDSYLIPMFPLKTNADMYKTADEFGYRYDDLPSTAPNGVTYGNCSNPDPEACLKDGYQPDLVTTKPPSIPPSSEPENTDPQPGSAFFQLVSIPHLFVLAFSAQYIAW